MNKKFIIIGLLPLLVCLFHCKSNSEIEELKQYSLIVSLDSQVSGSPAAGTHLKENGSVIDYSYTSQSKLGTLEISIDGKSAPPAGTLTVNGDHYIQVRFIYETWFEGTWQITSVWEPNSLDIEDSVSFITGYQTKDQLTMAAFMDANDMALMNGTLNEDGSFVLIGEKTYDDGSKRQITVHGSKHSASHFSCDIVVAATQKNGQIQIAKGTATAQKQQ